MLLGTLALVIMEEPYREGRQAGKQYAVFPEKKVESKQRKTKSNVYFSLVRPSAELSIV